MRHRGHTRVPFAACVFVLGCGGAPQPVATPMSAAPIATQALAASVTAHIEALPDGVTAEASACAAHPEACDGRDDDCDGHVDEGCGWESGSIQITLAWDGGADLDLYVTDPSGYTISYLDRTSTTGGSLDHDARGACIASGPPVENVRWTGVPPSGEYRVEVHYWGDCGVAGSTPAHVTVAAGGRILGTYDLILELGQRRTVLSFTI